MRTSQQPLVVGVDENGLGPRLGPLVATAVGLDLGDRAYDAPALRDLGARAGIDDSKVTSGFGAMAHAEGIALALVERLTGAVPTDVDALLAAASLEPLETMRAPCDVTSRPQCWQHNARLPAFGGSLDAGRRALDVLGDEGIQPTYAKSAVACVRVYNREIARRGSKLSVDLELFERLLLDASDVTGRPLEAICGMVGGIRKYPKFFARLPLAATLEEVRGRSSYQIPGLGRVTFEVDSDAHHMPTALASMLGKYVRELLTDRVGEFYRALDPELPRVSGYYDPVTARFVAATEPVRRRLAIADDCFERNG